MNSEQIKVLELLEAGTITAKEAAQLLEYLPANGPATAPEPHGTAHAAPVEGSGSGTPGKKLRVLVVGDTAEAKNINVNVSLPLALARYADHIIANCLPHEAYDELKAKGIDLKELRLGEIISTMEHLHEDIVNVDMDEGENNIQVRVYVE